MLKRIIINFKGFESGLFLYINNRFRPAVLGSQGLPIIVLGLIVYILIGILSDYITRVDGNYKEGMPMKTKMKKVFVVAIKSILNSVWTMGTNLLAGALLT